MTVPDVDTQLTNTKFLVLKKTGLITTVLTEITTGPHPIE